MISCGAPAPPGCSQTREFAAWDPSAGIQHPHERSHVCFLCVWLSLSTWCSVSHRAGAGGKKGASGRVRLKDDSRSPRACRDRTLTAGPPGPPHGLYPFCRGASQQPGLLLPHPSEIRRRQKLLWVHWPVVFPQGNC